MKTPWCLAGLLALATLPAQAAGFGPACAAKKAEIQREIRAAEARGHDRQVAGLQRALKANARCTDEALARERERDIRRARSEVAERERELAEAQRDGDRDKIERRSARLDEARAELERAQRPLPR